MCIYYLQYYVLCQSFSQISLRHSLIGSLNETRPVMLEVKFSCIGNKSQEHRDFAFDAGLSINISCVSFYRTGAYAQKLGYVTIVQTLAEQLCYLALTRRQTITPLHI